MKSLSRTLTTVAAIFLLAFLVAGKLVSQTKPQTRTVRVTLLHVSDVSRFTPVERGTRGGLARVKTLRKQVARESPNTVLLLAGNTLAPSIESIKYKGSQMIAAWNDVGLDYAVLGNHEFDFGPLVLQERIQESRFVWLGANVIDTKTGRTFADTPPYVIREFGGVKVGFVGLALPETKFTSRSGPNTEFENPCVTANRIIPEVRARGAQVVVALTHLSDKEDKELARCAAVDVILGGHSKALLQSVTAKTPILKVPDNARDVGRVDLEIDSGTGELSSLEWQVIPVSDAIPDDPEFVAKVTNRYGALLDELDQVVGQTNVLLDARAECNRTRETNIGNFIADAFRNATNADVALINAGSIRADLKISPGTLTKRDVISILPFSNKVIKLELTGATLRQALEHSVSRSAEDIRPGRFPQVSGLSFAFQTTRPPGLRVVDITVGGKPLDDTKTYTLATNDFIGRHGADGYDMFKTARVLIAAEEGPRDLEVITKAISSVPAIAPRVEGRILRVDDIEKDLNSSVSCVYERFNNEVVELKPVKANLADGRVLTGYETDKVKTIIDEAKVGLLTSLNHQELGAMRAYVEENFPRTSGLPTFNARVGLANRSHHPQFFRKISLTLLNPARTAINKTRDFIADVRANTTAIVFEVQSIPDGANVILTPGYGNPIAAPTNSRIPGFYRGKYSITVTKNGYKTISQPIQNFWSGVVGVKCVLRKDHERDHPLFCERILRR